MENSNRVVDCRLKPISRRPSRVRRVRVAMAQISPMLGDVERNLALHLEQIEAARRQHADLIVFPELSLTGYVVRDMVPDLAICARGAGDSSS